MISRLRTLVTVIATIGIGAGTLAAAAASAADSAADSAPNDRTTPSIGLITAQSDITVSESGSSILLDPGIWVGVSGAPLRFDVGRKSYSDPVTIAQVFNDSRTRSLPASVLDGWNGLKDFIQLTVSNTAGSVVGSDALTFCPNSSGPAPISPDTTGSDTYPTTCGALDRDPFELSDVWGIPAGWAVDPTGTTGAAMSLGPGTYRVTENITPSYVKLLGIQPRHAEATVTVTIVNGQSSPVGSATNSSPANSSSDGAAGTPGLQQTNVPLMTHPPTSVLPDLVPLPAWQITTANVSGSDLLEFGATVWVGGNGPLDVQGFRADSSPIMPAYQYFWKDGKTIGKAPVGTMGFDSEPGHNHWHFEQFAEYQLLGANKNLVVRSQKVGFCIGPTDPVDLTLAAATWLPPGGFGLTRRCGVPTALWVDEQMPVGWGDTYEQTVAGQAFDITNIPNGTYYIEIVANPMHVLYETNTANDTSLREIILSGTPGDRHVTVPPYDGIDPEG